jgi:dipeptidyl aminopeptidase/acylaminoacyl peptidase
MLAYIAGADRNDPHAGMLYVVDVTTKQVRALTEGLQGAVNHVAFGGDGAIRAAVSLGVRSTLMRIDPRSGESKVELSADGQEFRTFELGVGGNPDLFRLSTPEHPFEVYARHGDELKRLTDSNPWLADVAMARHEIVRFKARDGLEIEGILMHPLRRQEGVRSPLVIVVHGGPEAHFSNGWLTSYGNWGQVLAAKGFALWFPNYRASTGYGVAFAKANFGDVMGGEFNDHLDAIDHFAGKGLIDPDRVGIGGGSYGGYAAAWAATRHTDRFAAAVSFVPFVDIRTKWFTSDIPYEFYLVHYQEKWPHEQSGYLSDRSPLTHAAQCRTPLLLLGGTSDTRVHPSQPMMLHRAVLFQTKTPTRYVQYPGEGHGNRTNVAQYDYVIRTMQWFEHYLQPGNRRREPLPSIGS